MAVAKTAPESHCFQGLFYESDMKNPPQSPFFKGGGLKASLFDKEGVGEI